MNHRAKNNSPDVGTVYQPNCVDPKLSSDHDPEIKPAAPAALNGAYQNGAKLEWAKDVLAQVIRTIGENPDAPFATAALQAAALIEQHDLATFARYRRNLKQGHISITVLDAGLQRLKTRPRAMARLATAARPAVARPAPAASSTLAHPGRGRELKLPEPQPWPAPVDESLVALLENVNSSWSTLFAWSMKFLGLSFRDRLRCVFQDLADKYGARDSRGILLMPQLSHDDLAEMIGSSRAMVSRLIAEFIDCGELAREARHFIVVSNVKANRLRPPTRAAMAATRAIRNQAPAHLAPVAQKQSF